MRRFLRPDDSITNVPGPSLLPLANNLHHLNAFTKGYQYGIDQLHRKYGKVVRFWLPLNHLVISVTDPCMLKTLYNDRTLIKPPIIAKLASVIRDSVFLADEGAMGHRWKAQRSIVTEGLNLSFLRYSFEMLRQIVDKEGFLKADKRRNGMRVDLLSEFNVLMLELIGRSCFGVEHVNTINGPGTSLLDDLSMAVGFWGQLKWFISPSLHFLIPFICRPMDRTYNVVNRVMELRNLQQPQRQQQRQPQQTQPQAPKEDIQQQDPGSTVEDEAKDLLAVFLRHMKEEKGHSPSWKEIEANLLMIMYVGHGTTATTLTWVVYHLCRHPSSLEAVQAELDEFFQQRQGDDALKFEDFISENRLPYLSMAIKESMRLLPVAITNFRYAVDDMEICGWKIPKGTILALGPGSAQRDPDVWEDAAEFRPERFQEKGNKKRSWLPFGMGPRICAGKQFATLCMRFILARLLSEYTPVLEKEEAKETGLVLQPKGGLWVRLVPRTT